MFGGSGYRLFVLMTLLRSTISTSASSPTYSLASHLSIFHELLKPSPSPGVLTPGSSHDTALAIDDVKLETSSIFEGSLKLSIYEFRFHDNRKLDYSFEYRSQVGFDVLKDSALSRTSEDPARYGFAHSFVPKK
ncbi:hypothetical protein BDQ17DRAFT_1441656 [Cyathus striatus]|nr:hypothetical protein BDQ17DRAFT_1441656 [Cyathus striatus]